jgi:hypothetical protein
MPQTSVNNSCKITNNSSKSVVVVDAFTSTANINANSPRKGYQQTLKLLPLASGKSSIAPGASDSVTLNDTYQSNGQTMTSYLYQLLISEAQSLFPVMNVGEAVDFSSMSYPPVVVTAAAQANMALAFQFCQNIMAYPGSNLATGFVNAMNQAQQQTTVSAMMQTIADYFNTTKQFQGLDFPSYLAVSTYIQSFAWVWGLDSGTPGRTYWLYSQADAQNGYKTCQGTVVFTLKSDAPNPADPTDSNSGYSIVFNPTNGAGVQLYFNNGQLVNDVNVDVPSFCLQGSYALKSTFTQNQADNVLWAVLCGTLNGQQVIGVSAPPETASGWSIAVSTFKSLVSVFLEVMGVVMAIDFIKTKLEGKKNNLDNDQTNKNEGRAPNSDQVNQADANANQVGDNAQAQAQANANRMGNNEQGQPNVEVPDANNLPNAQADVNNGQVEVANNIAGDNLQAAIDQAKDQADQLAEIEVNPPIENAYNDLMQANNNLPDARQSGDFTQVKANLSDATANVNAAVQQMDLPQNVQQEIKESQAVQQEFENASEQAEDQAKTTEEGKGEFEGESLDG